MNEFLLWLIKRQKLVSLSLYRKIYSYIFLPLFLFFIVDESSAIHAFFLFYLLTFGVTSTTNPHFEKFSEKIKSWKKALIPTTLWGFSDHLFAIKDLSKPPSQTAPPLSAWQSTRTTLNAQIAFKERWLQRVWANLPS